MEKWKPEVEEEYYTVDFMQDDWCGYNLWYGDNIDNNLYNRGLVFKTKEEAVKKAKEICGIYDIDGVEYRRGEKVLVKNMGAWNERMFFEKRADKVLCLNNYNKGFFEIDECYSTGSWRYIKKPGQFLEVTMEEVCEKFGCEVKIKKGE